MMILWPPIVLELQNSAFIVYEPATSRTSSDIGECTPVGWPPYVSPWHCLSYLAKAAILNMQNQTGNFVPLRKHVDLNGISCKHRLGFLFWFQLLNGMHIFLPLLKYLARNVKEHYLMLLPCIQPLFFPHGRIHACVQGLCCAVSLSFFFPTFLHKPVLQDSASSRILCPCITSCDDLASSVQRDYEVHRETRGKTGKKVRED